MSSADYLQGACVWNGVAMQTNPRWVKVFPPAVLDEIDVAVDKLGDTDWTKVNCDNFPLPSANAFFDDVREELENGSGMVKIRGLDVGRYN